MESRRGGVYQQVPEDFAVRLRELRAAEHPMFNLALAVASNKKWRTPTLASVLEMSSAAVSKRIERVRSAEHLTPPQLDAAPDVEHDRLLADYAARWREVEERLRQIALFEIPDPVPVRATIDGRRLDPDRIAQLQEMQRTASKVNGAMPPGHPARRVSEAFSIALDRLINDEGFTPYYLAGVLGISHRAVTSRLERHNMRTPCPSVAGTASGGYYGRKIGDPGQGAPRLSHEQRTELRELWQRYVAAGPSVRGRRRRELAEKLGEYTEQGFTLANLAQTMSTEEIRVRYGGLQAALAGERVPAGART